MQLYLFDHVTHYYYKDSHHVDDEEEAAAFINDRVRQSIAFLMDIGPTETEQDAFAITGTTKLHEMRYDCFCCLDELELQSN